MGSWDVLELMTQSNLNERILDIIIKTLRKAAKGVDAAYAIILEAFKSLTKLQLEIPSKYRTFFHSIIDRFAESSNNNLKYNGLLLLMNMFLFYHDGITEYHEFIFDCLESADDTLKQTAIDLLYKSSNHGNIERITIEILKHLCSSTDSFRQRRLTEWILEIGDFYTLVGCSQSVLNLSLRHGIDKFWYIDTLVAVLQFNAEMEQALSEMVIQLFAKHQSSLENPFISKLLEQLTNVTNQDVVLSSSLTRVIAWAFGEWFMLASNQELIIQQLFQQLRRSSDPVTQICIHNALTKILSQTEVVPERFTAELEESKSDEKAHYKWICRELELLCIDPKLLHHALCSDDGKISIKPLQVDEHMSFLDEFVAEAITKGALSYDPTKSSSWLKRPDAKNSSIKYRAYESPEFADLRSRDFEYGINSPSLNTMSIPSLHDGYESARVSEDMPEPSILPTIRSYLPTGVSQFLRKDYFSLPNRSSSMIASATSPRRGHPSNGYAEANTGYSLSNAQRKNSLQHSGHLSNTDLENMSQSMYTFSRSRHPTRERNQDLRASLPNVLETKGGTIIRHDLASSIGNITENSIIQEQTGPDYHMYQNENLRAHLRKIHQSDSVVIEIVLRNISEVEIVKFVLATEHETEQLSVITPYNEQSGPLTIF
ncbi:AP-4 complex subunit epsilon-1 [Basidiobolus ranarum]|uniref:AP-4 complex subunit epsilon-1 n=1 Tax=Basidiobolus ranarum TaxID=34480 RepID=A0ABR2VNP9_9FUNG